MHALLQQSFEAGTTAWGGHDHVPVDRADDVDYFTRRETDVKKPINGDKRWAVEAPVTGGEAEEDGEWREGEIMGQMISEQCTDE